MNNRYIEKSFIPILCISLVLHMGALASLYFFPPTQPERPKEPIFIDLKIPPVHEQPIIKRPPLQVIKKPSALRKEEPRENVVKSLNSNNKNYYMPPKGSEPKAGTGNKAVGSTVSQAEHQQPQVEPKSSVSSLLKPKKAQEKPPSPNDLSMKKGMLDKIEEQTRNMLGSNGKSEGFGAGDGMDLSLISFTRRFLDGATSHLVYPPGAKELGQEGVGAGEVTFNRKGEVVDIVITKSIGKDFDNAVRNAINNTVVGPLSKAYKQDTVTLPFVYIFELPPQERRKTTR